MRIQLTHPHYQILEDEGDTLVLKSKQQELLLQQGQIAEPTATLVNQTIHIVALLNKQRLVHWHGEKDLIAEDISRDKQPIKGLQLITDSDGKVNLFYLQQNAKQGDYTLIQRVYTDSWSEPLRVTTNISNMSDDYRVCPGLDNYLHLVYVGLEGDTLFYRCFDLAGKIWSGAIPLVKEECSSPQIYLNRDNLLLTWISETDDGKRLRALWQKGTWGKPESLSLSGKDIYQPGISWEDGLLTIHWLEGTQLCARRYDQQWSELRKISSEEKRLTNKLVTLENSRICCTWSMYEPYIEQEIISERTKPEGVSQVKVVEETNVKGRTESQEEKQRREVEQRFWQEAFQLHHQWQQLQQEYQAVLQQGQEIETRLISKLQEMLNEHLPFEASYSDKFTKLAEDLQLANQRVLSLREEFRGMRQTSGNLRQLEERITKLETNQVSQTKLEGHYLNVDKRVRVLEGQLTNLSQQVAGLISGNKKRSMRAKTFLKRLIWR